MDSEGGWVDNVFVERLWRSVKYEEVCLHTYATPSEANRCGIATSVSTTCAGPNMGFGDLTPRGDLRKTK